jgi:hypothetical protein
MDSAIDHRNTGGARLECVQYYRAVSARSDAELFNPAAQRLY